jgi:AcrR family transcriptional regulator
MAPRERNASATRAALLRAARTSFSAASYDNVGLREIAHAANVDVALIRRYFGSKEALFEEALGRAVANWVAELPDEKSLARALASACTSNHCEDIAGREPLLIIASSLSSSMRSKLKDFVGGCLLICLAALLDGPEKEDRAAAAITLALGSLARLGYASSDCDTTGQVSHGRLCAMFELALQPSPRREGSAC